MSYTELSAQHQWRDDGDGPKAYYLCEVFADTVSGMDAFIQARPNLLPGSTVDIADLKTVFRLRNDGSWEEYRNYSGVEPTEEAQAEAVAMVLDDIISDEDIAGMIPEEGEEAA